MNCTSLLPEGAAIEASGSLHGLECVLAEAVDDVMRSMCNITVYTKIQDLL